MAKQSIANPVVSLGLDSSGLKSGIASSMGDVKGIGNKIGQSLKSAIGTPLSLAGSAAAMAVPLNAALNIANMAASAAKSVLTAPVNALMSREAFQAQQNGMPILTSSDTGFTGVFARLYSQWEDLLADMMVALENAIDFRSWIEYIRGMMVGAKALLAAIFGPLENLKKDPQALANSVRAGAELTIDLFGGVAKISLEIYNSFVDIIKLIRNIPGLGQKFDEKDEAKIEKWLNDPRNQIFVPDAGLLGGRPGGQALGIQVPAGIRMNRGRDEAIKALGLNDNGPQRIAADGIDKIVKDARENLNNMFKNNPLAAPPKDRAKDAATVAGVLVPLMERMAQSRLSSALTSDSTALVEAVTRASVAGPGQDLQQRVAMAAEENVRIAQATKSIQERILSAYENSPAYKNAPDALLL